MEALRIRRFETRYRLPRSALEHYRRLARIQEMVLDGILEHVLRRAGVLLNEEICIRRIEVPLRLRLACTDHELTLAWASAVAESIRRMIDHGRSDHVVRYGSRAHALVDFAIGVARGDLGRAWAWRKLELGAVSEQTSPAEAANRLIDALDRQPSSIVPVLRVLAQQGSLGQIVERLPPGRFCSLARRAATVSGQDAETLLGATSPTAEAILPSETATEAERVLPASPLARAAVGEAVFAPWPERLALAALAVLDAEPGLFRRSRDRLRPLLERLAAAISPIPATAPAVLPQQPPAPQDPPRATGRTLDQDPVEERLATAPHPIEPGPAISHDPWATPTVKETWARTEQRTTAGMPEKPHSDSPVPLVRRRAHTQMGGLLLLVRLVDQLGLPEQIADGEPFRERSFRWVLHRLAITLAAVEVDDAAALAFAGLAPDARPPSDGQPPVSESEYEVLRAWRRRIGQALQELLDDKETAAPVLIDWICRRRAEVVADPGWIEVRFSRDDVSTEIRRAGLDLDPGFVPWLGVVLKFVYE